MKGFDLYKAIIFASVLLIPGAGVWVWWQTQRLEQADKAIYEATKPGGNLEKIGLLLKEIDTIKANLRRNESTGHLIYFETRIQESATLGSLNTTDYQIGDEQIKKIQKLHARDYEVGITFTRANKALPLSRDFIHAMLLNCERYGSWRLRELELSNTEAGKANGRSPPPKTVADSWLVTKLTFARRAPDK